MTDTDDLVKQLRAPCAFTGHAGMGKPVYDKLRIMAADRIEVLTAQLAALQDEAKEVVRPFPKTLSGICVPDEAADSHGLTVLPDKDGFEICFTVGDLRLAAAFLAKLEAMKL